MLKITNIIIKKPFIVRYIITTKGLKIIDRIMVQNVFYILPSNRNHQ